MAASKKELISDILASVRGYRFCGPSDDPDEQTAVTAGFRHLTIQLKRLVAPLLPESVRIRLESIEVEVNDLFSAFDAHSEIQAMLPDIEAALEHSSDSAVSDVPDSWIVSPAMIDRVANTPSSTLELKYLLRICKEINSCYSNGNIVATVLLMRAILNYVPPAFGHITFDQVTANVGRTLKESFSHLENGLRKIADFHTHRKIGSADSYPTLAQVEPYKPQFELLLQEFLSKVF